MADQAGAAGGSEFTKWGYPPVPAPGADYDPSSPPADGGRGGTVGLAASQQQQQQQQKQQQPRSGRQQQQQQQQQQDARQQQQPKGKLGAPRAVALVETPKIEPQPWVKAVWSGLKAGTVGVARIDLRRPTFPAFDEYDERNLLFRRRAAPRRGRPPTRAAAAAHAALAGTLGLAGGAGDARDGRGALRRLPNGARFKVLRCVHVKSPELRRPLLDLGVGLAVDLDRQNVYGVARLKLGSFLSLKLAPQPAIKVGATWPLGKTGTALRFRYECPISNIRDFWHPPARLMLRIDNDVGTGIHFSPTGIEFDERRLALGNTTELRAGATLMFPRSLPMDPDDPDALRLHVHRLSLKTNW